MRLPNPRHLQVNSTTKRQRRIDPEPLVGTWTDTDPWNDHYLARELGSMQWLVDHVRHMDMVLKTDETTVRLDSQTVRGPVECYMRRDFLEFGRYPRLRVDGKVWMSVTPMEIESHYMPIKLAHGQVGIGGMGLGYAALRMASKPEVEHVTVWENNKLILQLWERLDKRGWLNDRLIRKITIVEQDVYDMEGYEFDFFYNDVYATMWDDATFDHWDLLTVANDIGIYHWWGFESWLIPWILTDTEDEVPKVYRTRYWPYIQDFFNAIEHGHGILGVVAAIEECRKDVLKLNPTAWPVDACPSPAGSKPRSR